MISRWEGLETPEAKSIADYARTLGFKARYTPNRLYPDISTLTIKPETFVGALFDKASAMGKVADAVRNSKLTYYDRKK